ncbi:MAG TPA: PEGA domain-containing protein [Vicinamibacterales bacterium]|jgi:hypothetical protein
MSKVAVSPSGRTDAAAAKAEPQRLAERAREANVRLISPNVEEGDTLDIFELESAPPALPKPRRRWQMPAAIAVGSLCLAAGLGFLYARSPWRTPARPVAATGHVTLSSRPEGAQVSVDGTSLGITPLNLELPTGDHDVVFRSGEAERHLPLRVEEGVRLSEHVDLPPPGAASGQIEVTSDPSGARVTIDGNAAGVTPLTVPKLNVARHVVAVKQGDTIVTRTVDVTSGATASVFVALPTEARGGAGKVAFESPLELRVMEGGHLIGLSTAEPLMLPAGRHQFELVNDSIDLRIPQTVIIAAGKSVRVAVPLPNGTLSVNAQPWAEVFVDGRSLGTTPLGDLSVRVGSHELTWRHPQLGEKHQTVLIGAQKTTRVSADLRR